jgi:GYF domain 2
VSEEAWYFVDSGLRAGPISLQSLKETLVTLPHAENVLVWCNGFPDWKIAGDVEELRAMTPPPVPKTHLASPMPSWRVRWWWYPVALVFFGSIGNGYGRKAMAWVTDKRQAARMIKRKRRQH